MGRYYFLAHQSQKGGVMMKKLVSALCAAGICVVLAATVQAETPVLSELRKFIPGECYLDGRISPPKTSLESMDGFEVPLVAMWIPLRLNENIHYRGDAKFIVYNFKIGEGELIEAYVVDVGLNRDDPDLSEEERHNRFIYRCEDGSGSCTATLATVKAAITTQIARDYKTEAKNIMYEKDSSVNFLGVFVKGINSPGIRTSGKKGRINLQTEVCGTYEYEITMAEASSIY
jgi:hypothetical protein